MNVGKETSATAFLHFVTTQTATKRLTEGFLMFAVVSLMVAIGDAVFIFAGNI